jgi:uncharacterized LabA/DUF88 family protein
MVFIDGGYLRNQISNIFVSDLLHYTAFIDMINSQFQSSPFYFDLLRIYYYDALSNDPNIIDHSYINAIKKIPIFEDRLGTLKISHKKRNQKGVDTLIAIDLLSKSHQNQFDIAILITGDEDFVPAIDYVKNTGKLVYGIFFENHCSQLLRERFDRYLCLNEKWFIDTGLKNTTAIKNLQTSTSTQSQTYSITFDIETTLNNKFLNILSIDANGIIKEIKTKKIKFSNQISNNNSLSGSNLNKSTETFSIIKSENMLLLITKNDIKSLNSFQIDFEDHLYHQWIEITKT